MNIVAIVQARMGSTRLPGKVLRPIIGKPMIELLLNRLSKSTEINEIVVATSEDTQDDELESLIKLLGYKCTRGSENDVLNRFYSSAKSLKSDIIVRITGDCPLVDPELVDECIRAFKTSKVDYCSLSNYPDGLDTEVMSFFALSQANLHAKTNFDREHVTPFIRNSSSFNKHILSCKQNLSGVRWSVDEPEDLTVVTNVFEYFKNNIFFNWSQVLELMTRHPELFQCNQNIKNNEGANMITGQKLYKRAKRAIPGGNMLLSKRPEMFLPDNWPSYFSKSKRCSVWDLDGKEYIDMSIMGVGTNILGYGHPEIDEAVMKTVKDGNMSTLNCPEEVYLAEKLIEINPWADMVRFSRSGGEVNSIAIRIARASSGKDKIAICGYHGWHDWYLSANLSNDKSLDGHLLPGLSPYGVPRSLVDTVLPFEYNNIEQLESLIKNNHGEIAAIKMEVSRNESPKNEYLQKVRDLATENKIILIFDECSSGFRETFGGLHKKYNVEPDMAIYGKALGNGYAITACVGKNEFMQAAQDTFISSTFWTERIGPSAALKTLEVMEREQSWKIITKKGLKISSLWQSLADECELEINTWGIPALSGFSFASKDALAYKTYITQEMLKNGYLAGNSVYVCTEHTDGIIDGYFSKLSPIFETIKKCEDGADIYSYIDGPLCHSGFKRLN